MPKPVKGPTLPQNIRFISFLFTKATLLVKFILRIFQKHSRKLKVPPVSQFGFCVHRSMKITDHLVLNFNKTFYVFSDTRETFEAKWHSGFS